MCRTLQTGPDILYGHIICRCTRAACRVRGRSRPNGRLAPRHRLPGQPVGPIASAPRLPARESYCLNNLRSEAEIRSRTRTARKELGSVGISICVSCTEIINNGS